MNLWTLNLTKLQADTFIYLLAPPATLIRSEQLRVTLQHRNTRTFTLGLVRAEGPPDVALLAHASAMLGATAAGLGRAVRTLAHVHYKYTC